MQMSCNKIPLLLALLALPLCANDGGTLLGTVTDPSGKTIPGARVTAGLSAPGGDPRVFQVDGSEIALRRETARRLKVRKEGGKPRKS